MLCQRWFDVHVVQQNALHLSSSAGRYCQELLLGECSFGGCKLEGYANETCVPGGLIALDCVWESQVFPDMPSLFSRHIHYTEQLHACCTEKGNAGPSCGTCGTFEHDLPQNLQFVLFHACMFMQLFFGLANTSSDN